MDNLTKSYIRQKKIYVRTEYPLLNENQFDEITWAYLPESKKYLRGSEFAWLAFLPIAVYGNIGEQILKHYFSVLMDQEYSKRTKGCDGTLNRESVEYKTSMLHRKGITTGWQINQLRPNGPDEIYFLLFDIDSIELHKTSKKELFECGVGGCPSEADHKQIPISRELLDRCFTRIYDKDLPPSSVISHFFG